MRIGEVAELAGVTTKAIRYYERIGLLPAAARTEAGYRQYEPETLTRLRFVGAAQAIGLSLGEIREVIAFRDRGEAPCDHVLALIARHADEITAQIEELGRLRAELAALAERARGLDPADCGPGGICHVIEPAGDSPR